MLLALLLAGCAGDDGALREFSAPRDLTAGQQALNYAGAPLRLVGAAVVLPAKLLLYDGPLRLWQATFAPDDEQRALELLTSGRPAERLRAAERLRRGAPAVPPGRRLGLAAALVRRLPAEPLAVVKNQLVLALGGLRQPWVAPRLAPLLVEQDAQLRGSAVLALGELGERRAGPLLVELYHSPWGENWYVRAALIQAAGKLGLVGLLPEIRRQIDDPHAAGGWLLQVVALQAAGRLRDVPSLPRLRRLAGDPNEYVRTAATMALGRLGPPEELERGLKRAIDPREQLPWIFAIGRHGRPKQGRVLLPLLDSPDAAVRSHAAIALVELGDERGVEALIAGVSSRAVYERFTCAGRLEQLAGRSHGFDEQAWRRWWRASRGTLPLGRKR